MMDELSGALSFVVDEDSRILELIKIDDEGELFFRESQNWVRVEGDAPTIFDQTLADVTEEKFSDAIALYDQNEDITETEIADLVS